MDHSFEFIHAQELTARWLAARARGEPLSLEELCRDYPHLADEVRRLLKEADSDRFTLPADTRLQQPDSTPRKMAPSPPAEERIDHTTATLLPASVFPTNVEVTQVEAITEEKAPQIPGFILGKRIGRGGMGEVYEARKANLPDTVFALKIIRPDRLYGLARKRFQREAAILAQLDHKHIVRIFEYNEVDGLAYLTMRLLRGGTLSDRLKEYSGNISRSVDLMILLADAAGYVHRLKRLRGLQQWLLHRDIKPGNVLFDHPGSDATPYLSDFGLVKLAGEETKTAETQPGDLDDVATVTATGSIMGTPAYMAPEQFYDEEHSCGPEIDVYALGVMLYELTVGVRPYPGTGMNEIKLFLATKSIPRPSTIMPGYPAALEAIVMKCLEQEPKNRYHDAAELHEALCAYRDQSQTRAPQPSGWNRRMLLGSLGLLGMGGLGYLAYATFRREKDSQRPPTDLTPLEQLQQEFNAGKVVNLLDGSRQPRWSEWIVGQVPLTITQTPPYELVFQSTFISMLELFRGFTPGFRLQLEIQHEPAPDGYVGIYFGRSIQPLEQGYRYCMLTLTICDGGGLGPRVPGMAFVHLDARSCVTDTPRGFATPPSIWNTQIPLPQNAWHRIQLDFSAAGVIGKIDETDIPMKSRAHMMAYVAKHAVGRKTFAAVTPTFQPGEGAGFFTYGGRIRARNITVQPLEQTARS